MANHTIDKFKYGSDTFVLQDNVSGYTTNTGTVTSVGITNDTNGGLSVSGSPVTGSGSITIGHSNVLTNAQTTQAVYPIKIDKNGHISAYGSAVTIPDDTKVTQTPLNATNAYREVIVTASNVSSETTSTVGFAKNLTYNDYTPTLKLTKNSDDTKSIQITGDKISVNNGQYTTNLAFVAPTSSRSITFPNATGTVALTSDIPTITDTYSGTSSDGMSGKAVKSAIDALDGSVTGTAGASKTLTAFSQANGIVTATFGNISITKSQVSDFPTNVSTFTNDAGYVTTDEKLKTSALGVSTTTYYPVLTTDVSAAETKKYSTLLQARYKDSNYDIFNLRVGNGVGVKGRLQLSNSGSSGDFTTLTPNAIGDTTITLPSTSGTLALTSDIPTVPTISLNGSSTTSPSFYAPTSAGTSGYYLKSNGSGAPTWTNFPTIPTKTSDLTNDSGFITDVSDKVDKTYTLNGETSSIDYNSGDGTVNITSTNSYETAQITTYNNSVSLYSATSDTDPTISHPGGSSNIFLDWGALTIDAIDNTVSATHFDPAIRIEPEKTTIKYVVTPTEDEDAANKQYVDDSIPTVPVTDVTVGGTSVVSSGTAVIPAIPTVPTNVSAFTNDAGYLTSVPVSDVTVNGSSVVSSNVAALTVATNWLNGSATGSVRTSGTNTDKAQADAAGDYSLSEGRYTVATGEAAHAEGHTTRASGNYSHAEGSDTTASGNYSHAGNHYTNAVTLAQTALGEFNVLDTGGSTSTRGNYAVIVGNGTGTSARSNALNLTWGGDIYLALDTSAASGTVDGDLYSALNTAGWANSSNTGAVQVTP